MAFTKMAGMGRPGPDNPPATAPTLHPIPTRDAGTILPFLSMGLRGAPGQTQGTSNRLKTGAHSAQCILCMSQVGPTFCAARGGCVEENICDIWHVWRRLSRRLSSASEATSHHQCAPVPFVPQAAIPICRKTNRGASSLLSAPRSHFCRPLGACPAHTSVPMAALPDYGPEVLPSRPIVTVPHELPTNAPQLAIEDHRLSCGGTVTKDIPPCAHG